MIADHERELDDELRRRALDSSAAHRRSIVPEEVESALRATRSRLDARPTRRRRYRRVVAAFAVAAAVLMFAAVLWWPAGGSDERLSSTPDPDPAATPASASPLPSSPVAAESASPSTTTAAVVGAPTSVFDRSGDRLVTFSDDLNPEGDDSTDERSYFTEAVRDYLINRSNILGDTLEEREHSLFRGGLRIHTTLDPDVQAAAEMARDELPPNELGVEAAIVSLESGSGAIRAMVGGDGFGADGDDLNMAVTPRGTGSAVSFFILAAAIQAGAQADDVVDGRRGCVLPAHRAGEADVEIRSGVAGFVGSLRDIFARSVPCGSGRLSHIVGLDRVVDTIYRTAASAYLYEGQSPADRSPIQPSAGLATGTNEMSPLDLASGMQTLANDGVHHAPYYVEYIEDPAGNRIYTHRDDGTRELDRDAALETIDVLKGVLDYGTGRRYPPAGGRAAFGVTGTRTDLHDAFFIGATTDLTTAVWVGDPTAATPMLNVPEFVADGVPRVQGGTYPARIWKAFTDTALAGEPSTDWADPPPPARPNARLVLPGDECSATPGANQEPIHDLGTTVPPDLTDPDHPLTSVAIDRSIVHCS